MLIIEAVKFNDHDVDSEVLKMNCGVVSFLKRPLATASVSAPLHVDRKSLVTLFRFETDVLNTDMKPRSVLHMVTSFPHCDARLLISPPLRDDNKCLNTFIIIEIDEKIVLDTNKKLWLVNRLVMLFRPDGVTL